MSYNELQWDLTFSQVVWLLGLLNCSNSTKTIWAEITGRRNGVMPCGLLNFESMDTKITSGHAACLGLKDNKQITVSSKQDDGT
eukprot:1137164-Pelagomonas_calceolata.AAC.6